jgi:uncharacterized protein YjbI with pentapeptide repeats
LQASLVGAWRALSRLPAWFPDGSTREDAAKSFLVALVAPEVPLQGKPHPRERSLQRVGVFVAFWLLVPLTIAAMWAKYLPRHDPVGSGVHAVVFGVLAVVILETAAARRRLVDAPPPPRFFRRLPRSARSWIAGTLLWGGFSLLTIGGGTGTPIREDLELDPCEIPDTTTAGIAGCRRWGPRILDAIGVRSWLDLRGAAVANKPLGWDGQGPGVKSVEEADLTQRNMNFADLKGAFLPKADLRESDLRGADLSRADAQMAVFGRIDSGRRAGDLTCGRLRYTRLQGSFLEGAVLNGARLDGAHLECARLKSAQFREAELVGADLRWADLADATLRRSRLRDAKLGGARLKGAKLFEADFAGADLDGADLSDTNLSKVVGLTSKQLDRACINSRTLLPPGIDGPAPAADCTNAWRDQVKSACAKWR